MNTREALPATFLQPRFVDYRLTTNRGERKLECSLDDGSPRLCPDTAQVPPITDTQGCGSPKSQQEELAGVNCISSFIQYKQNKLMPQITKLL